MSYGGCIGARFARVILCHNPAKRSDAFSDDVSGTVGPPFSAPVQVLAKSLRKERLPSRPHWPATMGSVTLYYLQKVLRSTNMLARPHFI